MLFGAIVALAALFFGFGFLTALVCMAAADVDGGDTDGGLWG